MLGKIEKIAVTGVGSMGGSIAQSLASGGMNVVIATVSGEATQRSFERFPCEAGVFEHNGLCSKGTEAIVQADLGAVTTIKVAAVKIKFVQDAVQINSNLNKHAEMNCLS